MPCLLTVVIPTYRRPALLAHAIASALVASPNGDVEVVVVPNGPDESWKAVAAKHVLDPRIRWHPSSRAGASAARNAGLSVANGKYVRFLDDDDVLYSEAVHQIEALESNGGDIDTGPLSSVDVGNSQGPLIQLTDDTDFVCAVLRSVNVPLAQGSVFRASVIRDCDWPEAPTLYDDYLWMLEVAKRGEWRWQRRKQAVAAYVQHPTNRLSRVRRSKQHSQRVVDGVLSLLRHLRTTSRASSARTSAAATALLTHAHSAFPSCPFYLDGVIRLARKLDEGASPLQSLFRQHPLLADHLAAAEWAMLLPRHVTRAGRRLGWQVSHLIKR